MLLDIWQSFRSLPAWVQIWVGVILMPINFASLLFIEEPMGVIIAALAIGGMLPNAPIMLLERGLSKAMSLPHIAIWIPLLWVVADTLLSQNLANSSYFGYLIALLVINTISIVFDLIDGWHWLRGDRAVAGH